MEFDLAGHVRLSLAHDDPVVVRAVSAQMDPYLPAPSVGIEPVASVVLGHVSRADRPLTELQLAAGDGLVTGSTDAGLFVVSRGLRAAVPDAIEDEPAHVRFDVGYPIGRLFRQVVRPALQLRALAGGAVAVHAAAVEWHGSAVLVAGWSESGKTETALALAEIGARFLTDKWAFVAADPAGSGAAGQITVAPFPINVGVRRWVLTHLPRLRAALPRRVRMQLAAARAAGAVSRPVRFSGGHGIRGALADGAQRAVALADRAALSPTEVAHAYGHEPIRERRPVGLVVVLRTVPGTEVTAHVGEATHIARRLAASAVTERQTYFALRQRAAYAIGSSSDPGATAALEAERLADMLGRIPLVEVSAPFPTDPRRIVAAVWPWLAALE